MNSNFEYYKIFYYVAKYENLTKAATVLKTSQQKDKEGERLIKLFSVPCKPTKSNGMRTRNLPEHYPADWAKFKYYCIQDVNTEVDIQEAEEVSNDGTGMAALPHQ